ncbi:hypothetical protein ACFQ07_30970 [Actinomadura adrarensis]|uniref:Uncharacterized protein n=1 Tax=Actinomadura adrarensis TaxID=1819600 RepID=A0ABW3CRZ4_9ACTN
MPVDEALQARMAEPDFWHRYLFDDDFEDEDEDLDELEDENYKVEFGLGGEVSLILDIGMNGYFELGMRVPHGEGYSTLGWDDEGHFHPHVMRWSELDLLCRAMAMHDPLLRHPGPMLALLVRFAFLSDECDDISTMSPLIDAAFRTVRPGPEKGVRPETRDWYELRNLRGTGVGWTTRADGYEAVVKPDDIGHDVPELYSVRTPDSEDFPFAEWAALLDRARQIVTITDPALQAEDVQAALTRCTAKKSGHKHIGELAEALRNAGFTHPVLLRALEDAVSRAESCWVVATLAGIDQGKLVKRWFGTSPLVDARSWSLSLDLDMEGRPETLDVEIVTELNEALKRAGLGSAEVGAASYRKEPDGRSVQTWSSIDIDIRDHLKAAIDLITATVRRHNATAIATLKHESPPQEQIPL